MDFWQQCLLDEANYTVWIDEAGIRAGHKWRNEIADGIQVSIFFTFFTNHYNIMHSRSYLFTGLQCVSVHHDATLSKLCVLSRWGESSSTHTHTHTHTHSLYHGMPSFMAMSCRLPWLRSTTNRLWRFVWRQSVRWTRDWNLSFRGDRYSHTKS